jgi:hypothetical protein
MPEKDMDKTNRIGSLPMTVALVLILAAAPAFAHHSFVAEYDPNKPVTLTGTVTKVEWTNPHAHVYISVKAEGGAASTWDFELGSPNALTRHGWNRNSLKPGDMVTVSGYLAKDGANLANARSVSLADGRKIFSGDSDPAQ